VAAGLLYFNAPLHVGNCPFEPKGVDLDNVSALLSWLVLEIKSDLD